MFLGKQYKIPFLEVSAKNANNINDAFKSIAKQVMERMASSTAKDNKVGMKLGQKLNNGQSYGKNNQKTDGDLCC